MRNDFLQFVFYLIALVLGGVFEALLPKVLCVGFPVLLAFSVGVAARRSLVTAVLFPIAAGAFEDALASLPMMTSSSFFLVASLVAWRMRCAKFVMVVAYPLYQIWLKLIVPDISGSFGTRLLMAIPMAALAAFAVIPLLAWFERKAAVDDTP